MKTGTQLHQQLPKDIGGLFQIANQKDLGLAVVQGAKAVHLYLPCKHNWSVDIMDARDYLNGKQCPMCLFNQIGTVRPVTGFLPCADCFRPDVCAELGCAIKQGQRHPLNQLPPIKKRYAKRTKPATAGINNLLHAPANVPGHSGIVGSQKACSSINPVKRKGCRDRAKTLTIKAK